MVILRKGECHGIQERQGGTERNEDGDSEGRYLGTTLRKLLRDFEHISRESSTAVSGAETASHMWLFTWKLIQNKYHLKWSSRFQGSAVACG